MKRKIFYVTSLFLLALPFLIQAETKLGRASIQPSIVTIETGGQQKFKIIKMAEPLKPASLAENVKWYVNDVPGGNQEFGTIDASGLYKAPGKVPSPREIQIVGVVEGVANPNLFATVLIDSDKPLYELAYRYSAPLKDAKYFTTLHCVTMDNDGNLILVSEEGVVVRFSPEGKFIDELAGNGINPGQVIDPRAAIVDKEGNIFVSDQKPFGKRLQIFDNDGKLLKAFAEKGTGPGEILRAHGMDFGTDGNLYVIDVDGVRVDIYSHGGEFIKSWGEDESYRWYFDAPHGLSVDPNNDVFISDYYGNMLKFDKDGRFLRKFFQADPPDGSVYIHSMSDDKWGNAYAMVRSSRGYGGEVEVDNKSEASVLKFNNNGDYVGSVSLDVDTHTGKWIYIDDKGYLYVVFGESKEVGFEVYKPL
ncbi:MAG: NHL repeat-containing protein [Draconibacterium sp.]